MTEWHADERLDLSGVPCPTNFTRALLRLEGMATGEVLELIVDDGEPSDNVRSELAEEGHEVLLATRSSSGSWRILVRCE